MTVTLTPELEAAIQREMDTGRFRDPNDVIATALLVLSDCTPADLTALDADIQEGLDSLNRGELYSEEEARAYLAEVRAKL